MLRVLVNASKKHLMEDLHRMVQMAALYACVQDAATRHRVHAQAALPHLAPHQEHGVDVAGLAVSLELDRIP